jgi:gliding-associated putative ABC transporter substrate-binding component GldG
MNNRQQMIVRLVLVLGILVFLNILAVRYFARIDLTADHMYTLSAASKNLVASLDDKFTVKAYFNEDLPPPYNNNRRYLQDQLDEYRAYAKGNFQYELIDPGKDEEIEKEAQKYGIPPVQVQVVEQDKMQVKKGYMGLVFLYGDKTERIPVIQTTDNLEYEISSSLKKLTAKELKKVGFLTGHGEPPLQQMTRLQEMLAKQYQVTTVNLASGQPIPSDIVALLVVAPTAPLKGWEQFLIDQYLMNGGRLAFFLNKIDINLQGQMGRPIDLGLDDLLASYGVRVNTDLVRDVSCAYVTVSQQAGFMVIQNQVPFYYLPQASQFAESNPVVKGLGSVVFYFASSVDTSLARARGYTPTVLVQSSKRSGRQEGMFMVNPTAEVTPDMFAESGIPLVATVEGSFVSGFGSRPVGADSTVRAVLDTTKKLIVSNRLTKIVVAGDGDFLQDQYSGGKSDNFVLASNLVDWLSDDIGLSSIRSRESGVKPLGEVSDASRNLIKGLSLGLPPLLVVLAGLLRWRWRAMARRRLELKGL